MGLILFKLILPPVLILFASLAGRRWGEAVGGWLVGLPLTSGPIAVFLAVQYGTQFAALATDGSLVGTGAQACFSLIYTLLARRGWPIALVGGSAAYACTAFLLQALPLTHWGYFVLALALLTLAAWIIPYHPVPRDAIAPAWWDLPARMAIVAILVVTITAIAAHVGAQIAGVLASFPIFATILAIFAQRASGETAATQVLRGMVLSLYGFATFFFVLGLTLVKFGIFPAFIAAIASSLSIQLGVIGLLRRDRGAGRK